MAFFKKITRRHADGQLHIDAPKPDESPKPKRWTRVHQLLHDDRGLRYFFAAIGFILAVGFGLLAMLAQYKAPVIYNVPFVALKKPVPAKYYSPLTGVQIASKAATTRAVTAVMIENSPDARPQSGLKDSGVVYETIAEGGITRFLVLYQEQQPNLVGPVRSVRPYFVDWLTPYNASVAHVGGSYKALQTVRNGQYRDIDQFFNAGAYYRSSDRYAPHNVYTSFARLNALNKAKGYTSSHFTGFVRVTPDTQAKKSIKKSSTAEAPKPAANKITVDISSSLYNPVYTYSAKSKKYIRRYQNGTAHVDREQGQIAPKVVIVIKVPTKIGFEDGYREQMKTVGIGQGYVFQNGTVQKVTWKKASPKSQLHFLGSDGKDVPLEAGQTWITAIATDRSVTWQ